MNKHRKGKGKDGEKGKKKHQEPMYVSVEPVYIDDLQYVAILQEALSIRDDFDRGVIGLHESVFAFEAYVLADDGQAVRQHSEEFIEVLDVVADIQSIMISYADTYGIDPQRYGPIFTDIYWSLERIKNNLEEKQRKNKAWRGPALELVSQIAQVTLTLAQAVAVITGHPPVAVGLGLARSVFSKGTNTG